MSNLGLVHLSILLARRLSCTRNEMFTARGHKTTNQLNDHVAICVPCSRRTDPVHDTVQGRSSEPGPCGLHPVPHIYYRLIGAKAICHIPLSLLQHMGIMSVCVF